MFDRIRNRGAEPDDAASQRSEQMLIMLNRIETALVVRDPGNARSAEAYDGLRKQVIAASNERRRMLVLLAQLNTALDEGATQANIHGMVAEWSAQAGLEVVFSPVTEEHFDIAGTGQHLQVHRPAWVDSNSGMVVTRGIAEAVAPSVPEDSPEAESAGTDGTPAEDPELLTSDPTQQGDRP